MSHLVIRTEQHWRTYLPHTYAAISNKETFFRQLVDEAHAQIIDLAVALRGDDPANEPFAQKLARYEAARANAEAQIIRELLLLPIESDTERASEADVDRA